MDSVKSDNVQTACGVCSITYSTIHMPHICLILSFGGVGVFENFRVFFGSMWVLFVDGDRAILK